MPVQVRIPTILQAHCDGASVVEVEGATLGEVLDRLDERHPGMKGRILDEAGRLRRFVNVYVGEDDARFLGQLAAPTPDGVLVSVIPAVAGGRL